MPPLRTTAPASSDSSVQRSSSLRSRTSSNKVDHGVHGKPPKPPDGIETLTKLGLEDEKEKDMKNSGAQGAQGAILRKKKTKRRSTGIVQYNQDVSPLSLMSSFWCLLM